MSWVAIPCLAIYTVYSLIYESHRGWYSFVISTLTSFVYMFGFVSRLIPVSRTIMPDRELTYTIARTPGPARTATDHQLQVEGASLSSSSYARCQLSTRRHPQSVAHLPMKAMVYKTLSTVVDDFFACVTPNFGVCGGTTDVCIQILYQDAHPAPAGVFPRRRRLPDIPLPGVPASCGPADEPVLTLLRVSFAALDISGRSQAGE